MPEDSPHGPDQIATQAPAAFCPVRASTSTGSDSATPPHPSTTKHTAAIARISLTSERQHHREPERSAQKPEHRDRAEDS